STALERSQQLQLCGNAPPNSPLSSRSLGLLRSPAAFCKPRLELPDRQALESSFLRNGVALLQHQRLPTFRNFSEPSQSRWWPRAIYLLLLRRRSDRRLSV